LGKTSWKRGDALGDLKGRRDKKKRNERLKLSPLGGEESGRNRSREFGKNGEIARAEEKEYIESCRIKRKRPWRKKRLREGGDRRKS